MKTLKLSLVALLVSVALVNLANADGVANKPTTKVINISLEQAIQIPGLVAVMYAQLNPKFLNNNQNTFTVDVPFNGVVVRITGSYEEWVHFFRLKVKLATEYHQLEIDR